jgi:hypothetical protein
MATTGLLPYVYAITLGTSSVQILASNPTRKGVMFHNPGSNSVAVCPALNIASAAVPAVLNGAGSVTILPGGVLVVPQNTWIDAVATCAWNAIASGAGTPFTAWEF